MDNFKPDYVKKQEIAKENKARSMWVLPWQIKGLTAGVLGVFLFGYFYAGEYPAKYIVAGGIFGYLMGGLLGKFFYTKKE